VLSACRQQRGKIIAVVGNNADHFSALWAITLKNIQRCQQQRKIIATTRIKF
jgi:hypothetical protein